MKWFKAEELNIKELVEHSRESSATDDGGAYDFDLVYFYIPKRYYRESSFRDILVKCLPMYDTVVWRIAPEVRGFRYSVPLCFESIGGADSFVPNLPGFFQVDGCNDDESKYDMVGLYMRVALFYNGEQVRIYSGKAAGRI